MSKLKIIDGKLDLASVQDLSREDLQSWIYRRLHHQDFEVPGDARQGDMPYALLATIYPKLDKYTRQDIDRILIEFVRDMARNEMTSWKGDAAHNLLLLAQDICGEEIRDYLTDVTQTIMADVC